MWASSTSYSYRLLLSAMLCLPGYAYPCRGKCIPPSASSDCLAPRDSGLEDSGLVFLSARNRHLGMFSTQRVSCDHLPSLAQHLPGAARPRPTNHWLVGPRYIC